MGQTLSEPATDKTTEIGEDERFAYAVSEMQGWRITMEDSHCTVLNLDTIDDEEDAEKKEVEKGKHHSFFAVFDGHGGSSVARFAGKTVPKRLFATEPYKENNYRAALKRTFIGTDEALRADPSFRNDPSGCTAIALLITPDNTIFAANAGDSRSVLCTKGTSKPLSRDHKPQNDEENARIRAAGGFVEFGRVNGNLALSRALGDFEYKKNHNLEPEKQIVTSDPEITEHRISPEDEFIILACDGIWDCMTSQQVCNYVRRHVAKKMPLPEICESLVDYCMAPDADLEKSGIGCDNMTVIIVAILHGRTLAEWYDWIGERVANYVGYNTPETFPPLYRRPNRNTYRPAMGRSSEPMTFQQMARAFDLRLPGYTVGIDDDSSDEDEDDMDEEVPAGIFGGNSEANQGKSLRAQVDELTESGNAEAGPSGTSGKDVDMDEDDDGSKTPPGFTSQKLTSVGKPLVGSPEPLKNLSKGPEK